MVLSREGGINDADAQKIVRYLEIDQSVDLSRIDQVLARAKSIAAERDPGLKVLDRALQQHAKIIIQRLEQQDYNRDGLLNIDGFVASLRIGEITLNNNELSETFYLICGPDETLAYQSWIVHKFPALR